MSQFHNPFHFVPTSNAVLKKTSFADFDAGSPLHATHAKFLPMSSDQEHSGAYSGRIVCKVKTVTPLVIGSSQEGDSPKRILPFLLEGKPSVPGSALRGMVSSLIEAATNSALRVLENEVYSFRREMSEALSAIGMVVEREGCLYLRPLAMPVLKGRNERGKWIFNLPGSYRNFFPKANTRVYLGGAAQIRSQQFLAQHSTWTPDTPRYYGWKLASTGGQLPLTDQPLARDPAWQHLDDKADRHTGALRGTFLLARKPAPAENLVPWEDIPESERRYYVRGILRVLGVTQHRASEIPDGKKHELFIPYPTTMEADFEKPEGTPGKLWKEFPITKEAMERFEQLADHRTREARTNTPVDEILPYHPHGTTRNQATEGKKLRIKRGDLVYFRPNDQGDAVAEISFSSIWRGRVETIRNPGRSIKPVTTWDFFAGIDPDLLPAGAPAKRALTIAEMLLGFVENRPKATDANGSTRALASRLQFHHAKIEPRTDGLGHFLPPVILKILASPKPPSPALYFGPGYHAKNAIHQQGVRPKGRKVYLHHPQAGEGDWKTSRPAENLNQKNEVTPIREGSTFWFSIDFTNLSKLELGAMLYALEPTSDFQHRIGMGKPLGLGSVKISIAGIGFIDRVRRYSEDLLSKQDRFHHGELRSTASPPTSMDLPAELSPRTGETIDDFKTFFCEGARANGLGKILQALETLGDPSKIKHEVHYPALKGRSTEGEHYEWFVRNDKDHRKSDTLAAKEALGEVTDGNIPSLTRHEPIPEGRNNAHPRPHDGRRNPAHRGRR